MSFLDTPNLPYPQRSLNKLLLDTAGRALVCAGVILALSASDPASAASLSRSIDVKATPSAIWSAIGPFCAIKQWHPAIGTCVEDGKTPPTRTLVTKGGDVTFVEIETGRNDDLHLYSYAFTSSPLPVRGYNATIEVIAKDKDTSTIIWTGAYLPETDGEKSANDALSGIYEVGLKSIKAKFEH